MQNYSVLMSVYHKEKPEYLRQAIESIQVQTVPTNDFVLVCDGPLNPELDAVIAAKQQEMGESLNVVRLAKNGGLEDIILCLELRAARMLLISLSNPEPCGCGCKIPSMRFYNRMIVLYQTKCARFSFQTSKSLPVKL